MPTSNIITSLQRLCVCSTCVPEGTVLSPVLFSLHTADFSYYTSRSSLMTLPSWGVYTGPWWRTLWAGAGQTIWSLTQKRKTSWGTSGGVFILTVNWTGLLTLMHCTKRGREGYFFRSPSLGGPLTFAENSSPFCHGQCPIIYCMACAGAATLERGMLYGWIGWRERLALWLALSHKHQ